MTVAKEKGRVFGLDVMRAVAVLLVLIGHGSAHFEPPAWFKWFWGGQGLLGVEVFYVLSGYLIGGIIIRLAASGRLHSMGAVWDFWQRRWARTIPAYLLFLLIYMRFDYLGVADLQKVAPYFVFMQNFAWPQLPFFQHSWSLAVEELFYALFPLVFLLFAGNERSYRRPMLLTCLVFIAVPMLVRMWVARGIDDFQTFNEQIRMVVICRLDAIFFGVLLALIKVEWPSLFRKLAKFGVIGVLALALDMYYIAKGMPGVVGNYWAMVLFFPVLSLGLAVALPMVEGIRTSGIRLVDRFISYTSKVSYSLYLGHISMLTLVNGTIGMLGLKPSGGGQTLLVYAVYGVAFYGFATLTYYFVEQPYMKLRDAVPEHGASGRG